MIPSICSKAAANMSLASDIILFNTVNPANSKTNFKVDTRQHKMHLSHL